MTCGLCGSGVCADEKLKKQKNGNIHRYVYYGCNKVRDRHCKSGYLNEDDLIKQLEDVFDKIDLDEIGMKEKIKDEVNRFKRFQVGVLGVKDSTSVGDVDIRNYAKYILRDGKDIEKRELLGCLKSKILLSDKKVSIS